MGRHRKCQPHIHTRGVVLHGRIQKLLHLGKGDNLVEFLADFAPSHAQDGAVQENVLASRQLRVKPGADFEEACDTSPNHSPPLRRLGNAAEDLEKSALAGAITTNDAEDLAPTNL